MEGREEDDEEEETNEDNKLVKQLRIKEIVPISNTMTDCAVDAKFCHTDTDCEYLCKKYKRIKFACDFNHTCAPSQIDGGDGGGSDDDDTPPVKCDTSIGEYVMLVSYTTVGTAIWQCVQLYSHYSDRSKFCEGGDFDMNADIREPFYRDCKCPEGTTRAVYNIASFYDNSLPHCIPNNQIIFYKNSMIFK